jgi:hypothetical protein
MPTGAQFGALVLIGVYFVSKKCNRFYKNGCSASFG